MASPEEPVPRLFQLRQRSRAQHRQPQEGSGSQGGSVLCLLRGDPQLPPQERRDFPDLEATLPLTACVASNSGFFISNRSTRLICSRQAKRNERLPSGCACPSPCRRLAPLAGPLRASGRAQALPAGARGQPQAWQCATAAACNLP